MRLTRPGSARAAPGWKAYPLKSGLTDPPLGPFDWLMSPSKFVLFFPPTQPQRLVSQPGSRGATGPASGTLDLASTRLHLSRGWGQANPDFLDTKFVSELSHNV